MSSKWLWIAAIALCVVALLLAAVLSESQRISESAQPEIPQEQAYRIIGVWEGHVAVYIPQTDMPETVYDAAVSALPAEEQQRLAEGVEVADSEALARRLEDYLS